MHDVGVMADKGIPQDVALWAMLDRQPDRHTDRQTDRQTGRQTDRQTGNQE